MSAGLIWPGLMWLLEKLPNLTRLAELWLLMEELLVGPFLVWMEEEMERVELGEVKRWVLGEDDFSILLIQSLD